MEQLFTILRSMRNIIRQFNLFDRRNENEEERQIHRQRIANRVYIVLLIVILSVLIFYKSLTEEMFTETVTNPSESIYFQLQSAYPSSLRCQCSQMSINSEKFLSIQPILHPVCSSDLVSSGWIDLLRENYRPPPNEYADLFSMGAGLFQFLATFCETANTTIYSSLKSFLRRQIVTSEVLSKDLFNEKLNIVVEKWSSGVTFDFLQTIDLFRASMQGNLLLSIRYNFGWRAAMPGIVFFYFYGYILDYTNIKLCSCALSVYCATTLSLYDDRLDMLIIQGFVLACTPLTSLTLSDLRAFYNQSFIDELYARILFNSKHFPLRPIAASDTNRVNETIQSIVDRSFVDQ